MDDDWFLPGGAVVTDDGGRLRLRPPPSWHRVILELPRIPISMNQNEIRSHWSGFQKHKKSWQEEIETLLMVEKVKRDGYRRAMAGAFIRFDRRAARRDSGNFSKLVEKALGDALAGDGYGAIPDDDERRFYFGGVEIEDDLGPGRTRIVVYLQPKED